MSGPEEIDSFEAELTRALHRVDAPAGFAERLMVRAVKVPQVRETGSRAPRVLMMRRPQLRAQMQVWAGGAIAAMLAMGVFVAEQAHTRHAKQESAQQQFETATHITDLTLEHAREQLQRKGISLGE